MTQGPFYLEQWLPIAPVVGEQMSSSVGVLEQWLPDGWAVGAPQSTTPVLVITEYVIPGLPTGGGTTLPTRTTVTVDAELAPDASEDLDVPLAAGYRLYRVSLSHAARLRLYASAAGRTLDAERAIGEPLAGDHGLVLEYVSTPELLEATLSPLVDGYCVTGTAGKAVLTNLTEAAATVTATLTYVRTE